MTRVVIASCLLAACAHAPPTVTGAQLYAQVHELQTYGATTIGSARVFETSMLTTGDDGPSYVVSQIIEHCNGGDPTTDVDCTLALLQDQTFVVADHAPARRTSTASRDDRSGSAMSSVAVIGLVVGGTAGLIYGDATCSFAGCKALFTVPLVFIGGAVLFALGRD